MRPSLFGSEFCCGVLTKKHAEPSFHFLMGIWGSAFSICMDRWLQQSPSCSSLNIESFQDNIKGNIAEELRGEPKNEVVDEIIENEFSNQIEELEESKTNSQIEPRNEQLQISTSWKSATIKAVDGFFKGRKYRAARVHNFVRGLPVDELDKNDIADIAKIAIGIKKRADKKNMTGDPSNFKETVLAKISSESSDVTMVDAGLAFNSPYPLMLQAGRNVDLILSFDFSARQTDNGCIFENLMLAEEWATVHGFKFPTIDKNRLAEGDHQECYLFDDETDNDCPIILHFPIINNKFRVESGLPEDVRDFSFFDDPFQPYSTFNFTYNELQFDRLFECMKFNVIASKNLIEEGFSRACKKRQAKRRHSLWRKGKPNATRSYSKRVSKALRPEFK